jgi:hypothetical protein
MDFTFNTYKQLLQTLQSQGYAFTTLADYIRSNPKSKIQNPKPDPDSHHGSESQNRKSDPDSYRDANPKLILLRHDVEARYPNALRFAKIQHAMGIRGSYYFRLYPKPRNTRFIRSIAELGHEIGYHYDDLSFCKGNHEHAIIRFERHLDFLRTIAPVETITMEGAPLSAYDNRALWEKFDYKAYGILAEPYLDLNFGTDFSQTPNTFFYLTDTGRRWDGWGASLRDKVPQQNEWIRQGLVFHSTSDIIKAATAGKLPDHIMMTFHPQRWNDSFPPWLRELVLQNAKNLVKYLLVYSKR